MPANIFRFPVSFRLFSVLFHVALLSAGCSSAPTHPSNLAELQTAAPNDSRFETVAILGTNDLHGTLLPQQLKTREQEATSAPVEYEAGGATYLASYIEIARRHLGNRLLWLDAGDEWQGSIESNLAKGAPMVSFYNENGLHAAAVGNHEFDFGPESDATPEAAQDVLGALKARFQEAKYPYLSANILERATGKLAPLPNLRPSAVFDVGRLRVGVIGLSTVETPTTTRSTYVESLQFAELKRATIREAAAVRKAGADIVVVVAHVGLKCGRNGHSLHSIRKPDDPQGGCEDRDEMVQLLRSLPSGTVDAVVSGHSHQIVHHWVSGVPVIQGGAFGRYFNIIYLTYDLNQRRLVADRTRIEGPVPVCPRIFRNQGDCNGDRPAPKEGRGSLVAPRFMGERISADERTERLIAPAVARAADMKKREVGEALRPIEHERMTESPLGNLVADALRASSGADVALVNAGGIRAPIEQGRITYGAVFRSLPFDNAVSVVKVTGRQLKLILRIAESGSRGYPSVSGVRLRLISPAYDAPSEDLNGDKRVDAWEVNRLIDARLADGSPIRDERIYSLATIDFLVTGGDDLHWIMKQIPQERIQLSTGEVMRDAVVKYLATSGPLNGVETPLVRVDDPRLKFEAAPEKRRWKRRGR